MIFFFALVTAVLTCGIESFLQLPIPGNIPRSNQRMPCRCTHRGPKDPFRASFLENESAKYTGKDIESCLRKKMRQYGADSYTYKVKRATKGSIVQEAFEYIERRADAAMVTASFEDRHRRRSNNPNTSADKMNNRLTALPGPPGVGKSTFLVHYPESRQYRTYCEKYYGSHASPIVSAFTFNSAMDGGPESVGLRILYGAAVGMGIINAGDDYEVWIQFAKQFISEAEKLEDACEAVEILRRLFGNERPMLLLVDELSKADTDTKIMKSLGAVLNNKGDTDIVVSSLSPQYVQDLLTGSKRFIDYILLNPMVDVTFGDCREELQKHYSRITSGLGVNNLGAFEKCALLQLDLLLSGHPRSVEWMVEELKKGAELVDRSSITSKSSASSLLLSAAAKMKSIQYFELDLDVEDDLTVLEKFVLNPKPRSISSKQLRIYYEDGNLLPLRVPAQATNDIVADFAAQEKFIQSGLPPTNASIGIEANEVQTGLPLFAMLGVLRDLVPMDGKNEHRFRRVEAARQLFSLRHTLEKRIATWWERSIDLTIACRYLTFSIKLAEAFCAAGKTFPDLCEYPVPKLSIVRAKVVEPCNTLVSVDSSTGAVLMIPPPNHPGYDSRWTFAIESSTSNTAGSDHSSDPPLQQVATLYVQVKIKAPLESKRSFKDVLAGVLVKVVGEHVRLHPNSVNNDDSCALQNVHVVLYVWDDRTNKASVNKEEIMEMVAAVAADSYEDGAMTAIIRSFIDLQWENNIHVVSKQSIDNWLIPSLRSVPRIVDAIDEAAAADVRTGGGDK